MIRTLKQVLAALIYGQAVLCIGINFGLNSVTLIQVPAEKDVLLSADQLNWTIAGTALGGLLGGLLAVPVAPLLGARRFLMLAMPLHALGALAAGLGDSFVLVLLGRVVMYAALGATEGPARGYVSEIVPPQRRVLFSTFINTMAYGGQVAVLMVAPYLHWRTLFLVFGCAPPAVCLCGLLFLPDSARWLLAHGRSADDALRSIRFYDPNADAEAEVRKVQDSLAHAHHTTALWALVRRRETLRPLLIGATQMALFCWGGGETLVLITAAILEPLELPLDSYQRALVVPALGALLLLPCMPLLECCGRLLLLRAGGAVSALGCTIIAVYFFLSAELQTQLGWLALTGAVVVVIPFFCAIGTVSFVYVNELLPNSTRALGANLIMTSYNINMLVLLAVYPVMLTNIGTGGAFVLHAFVSLLQVLFATFCLSETKGLSLEQIQQLFEKNREPGAAELVCTSSPPNGTSVQPSADEAKGNAEGVLST